jgi:hypothetical protein
MNNAPVVIGGVGGSGTRVVAQIVSEMGFYIGNDLNNALDNLSFSFLMKRPRWFTRNLRKSDVVLKGLDTFVKTQLYPGQYRINDYLYFLGAMSEWLQNAGRYRINKGHMGNYEWWKNGVKWAWKRFIHLLADREGRDFSSFAGWGWKEPHSHIYLEYINELFPDFRYIHIIRHGLDMAFSKQREGVFLWGHLFGITPPSKDDLPQKMLQFWYAANKKIISWGEKTMKERFYLLYFEQFCMNPETELLRLSRFLGFSCPEETIRALAEIPELPSSSGRYRERAGIFTDRDKQMVEELGFVV